MTDQDNEIRSTDMPERFQVRARACACVCVCVCVCVCARASGLALPHRHRASVVTALLLPPMPERRRKEKPRSVSVPQRNSGVKKFSSGIFLLRDFSPGCLLHTRSSHNAVHKHNSSVVGTFTDPDFFTFFNLFLI